MECKFLIVDDDPTMLYLHHSLIVKSDLCEETHSFLNGEEAFEFICADEDRDTVYIVLLDLNMPVMNGWEFLDRVEESGFSSRVDIAIVSSSVDRSDKERARTYGNVAAFLSKPFFNIEEIKKMMNKRSAPTTP